MALVTKTVHYVLRVAEMNGGGDVDAEGRDAVFIYAKGLAVDEEPGGLPHAFELDEHLATLGIGRELEMLAIAGRAGGTTFSPRFGRLCSSKLSSSLYVWGVLTVVQFRVVEVGFFGPGRILLDELPCGVEVVGHPRRSGRSVLIFSAR